MSSTKMQKLDQKMSPIHCLSLSVVVACKLSPSPLHLLCLDTSAFLIDFRIAVMDIYGFEADTDLFECTPVKLDCEY